MSKFGKLHKIIEFITIKHSEQKRSGIDIPYVVHPINVMSILIEKGITDFDSLATALLHDTLEDTDTCELDILNLANEKVFRYVTKLTKKNTKYMDEIEKREYMNDYYYEISQDEPVKLIKLAVTSSILENISSMLVLND